MTIHSCFRDLALALWTKHMSVYALYQQHILCQTTVSFLFFYTCNTEEIKCLDKILLSHAMPFSSVFKASTISRNSVEYTLLQSQEQSTIWLSFTSKKRPQKGKEIISTPKSSKSDLFLRHTKKTMLHKAILAPKSLVERCSYFPNTRIVRLKTTVFFLQLQIKASST